MLAELHDPYFVSPTIIARLRGVTPPTTTSMPHTHAKTLCVTPFGDPTGEGVISIAAARTHTMALTDGGDVFAWGAADSGMLGIGAVSEYQEEPKLIKAIASTRPIHQIAVGTAHSVALTAEGEVMVWGHSANGRLGLGDVQYSGPQPRTHQTRFGVETKGASEKTSVTLPVAIDSLFLQRRFVRQVACGSQHCVALVPEGVVTWGCGDSGRLGHGDSEDRSEPMRIKAFDGMIVTQVWYTSGGVCADNVCSLTQPLAGHGFLTRLPLGHGTRLPLFKSRRNAMEDG